MTANIVIACQRNCSIHIRPTGLKALLRVLTTASLWQPPLCLIL